MTHKFDRRQLQQLAQDVFDGGFDEGLLPEEILNSSSKNKRPSRSFDDGHGPSKHKKQQRNKNIKTYAFDE